MEPGVGLFSLSVICCADYTSISARGSGVEEAKPLSIVGASLVIAVRKTEVMFRLQPRTALPTGSYIIVDGARVPVKQQLKYLGMVLVGRWRFTHISGN